MLGISNSKNMLFTEYFWKWVETYKKDAVRPVTFKKYKLTLHQLEKIAPRLKIKDVDRMALQEIMNKYGETHEKQTSQDFFHHLKACLLDAVDEGLIQRDPTRRIIVKGRAPIIEKKRKFLNQYELHRLIEDLDLDMNKPYNHDWCILLIAKTGMRYSEALGITPKDFDFRNTTVSVNKTLDYKNDNSFTMTKNKSSVRKITIDWQTVMQFSQLVKDIPEDKPIFIEDINKPIYNSTINGILERHCKKVGIPPITVHGLRHTHASLLLYAGANIASVSRRLGHSNMTTTQKVYLHVIRELENQDNDIIMRQMAGL